MVFERKRNGKNGYKSKKGVHLKREGKRWKNRIGNESCGKGKGDQRKRKKERVNK